MQAVPSLAGTGAAVAAAASGLVFGQLVEIEPYPASTSTLTSTSISTSASTPSRPFSDKTRSSFHDTRYHPLSHPGANHAVPPSPVSAGSPCPSPFPPIQLSLPPPQTTNAHRPSRTSRAQESTPKGSVRRQSFIRHGDLPAAAVAGDPRGSFSSSTGSWMRRLSIRPLSHHGSTRSSFRPESPSMTVSPGPAATIPPPSLPPNKLVKRSPSDEDPGTGNTATARQRNHFLSLRRPATSHQRSATLQQFQRHAVAAESPISPKFSLERNGSTQEFPASSSDHTTATSTSKPEESTWWSSFLHLHVVAVTSRSRASAESGSTRRLSLSSKRSKVAAPRRVPYLTRSSTLSGLPRPTWEPSLPTDVVEPTTTPDEVPCESGSDRAAAAAAAEAAAATTTAATITTTSEDSPSKQTKLSLSLQFSSPSTWISRNGSIRRLKRSVESRVTTRRYVSAPAAPESPEEHRRTRGYHSLEYAAPGAETVAAETERAAARQPNPSSSRTSPVAGTSGMNGDAFPLGPPAPVLPGHSPPVPRQHQPSGSSQTSSAMGRTTLNSFPSTDDNTDVKSDTVWDSLRTVASCRGKTADTPLEFLFDESPRGTTVPNHAQRLPVHDILGKPWGNDAKIAEEDEGMTTPVRRARESAADLQLGLAGNNLDKLAHHSPGRVSLGRDAANSFDDDFDDDWAKDDDGDRDDRLYCPLSPPSKGGSLNSKGISPHVRLALADISGNPGPVGQRGGGYGGGHRPLSSLFDLGESWGDKTDLGTQPSPSSPPPSPPPPPPPPPSRIRAGGHGIHESERGGRPPLRRGPHSRSHSVPVAQDASSSSDTPKSSTSKFGTWGIGTKTICEDWDDDFEFESNANGSSGKAGGASFAVPASIQATQPTVKAHSGQIREFSLLVDDLKRLCRCGRDLGLTNGPHVALWKEAEGIIALASPDQDRHDADRTSRNDRSRECDMALVSERFIDEGFDAFALQSSLEEITMSKTTVVRERSSPRRRSVFAPEDDIFGSNWPLPEEGGGLAAADQPRSPKTPEARPHRREQDISAAVQSVMEAVHHRAFRDKAQQQYLHPDGKVHFGTSSLKALVKRATDVRDSMSDIVYAADPTAASPMRTPRRSSNHHDNPAFIKVFSEPSTSPTRGLPQSHGANSMVGHPPVEASSPSGIGPCMQLMTVS